MELEHSKLNLMREGKLSAGGAVQKESRFIVGKNKNCFPRSQRKIQICFFSLFEQVAVFRDWFDEERTLLLLEASASLTIAESKNYDFVKTTVLRVYELVPEAGHVSGFSERSNTRLMLNLYGIWLSI